MTDREEWCPRCHRPTARSRWGYRCVGCMTAEHRLWKHWLTEYAQLRLQRERDWQRQMHRVVAA